MHGKELLLIKTEQNFQRTNQLLLDKPFHRCLQIQPAQIEFVPTKGLEGWVNLRR